MKIKRKDKIRKTITFFHRSFGFKPTFKVLLDADFLFAVLKSGLMLDDLLNNFFEGEKCSLFITKCIKKQIVELSETPGPYTRDWVGVLQIIENRRNNVKMLRCFHPDGGFLESHECIHSHISATDTDYSNTKKQQVREQSQPKTQPPPPKQPSSSTKHKATHQSTKVPEKDISEPNKDNDEGDSSDDDDDNDDDIDINIPQPKKLSFQEQQQIAKNNAKHDNKIPHLNTQLKVGSSNNLEYNANKLFLCAQHSELRIEARKTPIVPIIFLQSNFLVIESPTPATQQIAQRKRLESQRHATESESALDVLERLNAMAVEKIDIDSLKKGRLGKTLGLVREGEKKDSTADNDDDNGDDVFPEGDGIIYRKEDLEPKTKIKPKHRPKKAKGPNPLSCKPKKKKQMPTISKKKQKLQDTTSTSSKDGSDVIVQLQQSQPEPQSLPKSDKVVDTESNKDTVSSQSSTDDNQQATSTKKRKRVRSKKQTASD